MTATILFGGTFDPVHEGHVAMVRAAHREIPGSTVTVLPAGNPYQKGRPPVAGKADRVAMLALAFAADGFAIDGRELDRHGPTYTIETLEDLHAAGTRHMVWLLGGDSLARLDSWHRWRDLFTLASFAVIRRGEADDPLAAASPALAGFLRPRRCDAAQLGAAAGHYAVLVSRVPHVSSTDVRARLTSGQSVRGLVPDSVCDYIDRNRLYTS